MENIILSKNQRKEIVKAIYGDIRRYCDDNFERFFSCYLEERNNSKGLPLEPITIRFNPCFPCDYHDITDDRTDIVERKENI